MKAQVESAGKVLTVLTALIGIWTFIAKTASDYQSERRADVVNLGRAFVFDHLRNKGAASFDQLLTDWQKTAVNNPVVEREDLTDSALRQTLVDLAGDQVIYVRRDGTFDLYRRVSEDLSARDLAAEEEREISNEVGLTLEDEGGRHNLDQLAEQISKALSQPVEKVKEAIERLIRWDYLIVDEKGNLSNAPQLSPAPLPPTSQ